MKSKNSLRAISYLLVIAVFNLIYFALGGADSTAAGWIAYAFTYVAIIVSFVAPLYCINYKRIPENLITIYIFAWIYTIIGVVMNTVIMITQTESIKVSVILNVILLVIYFIQLVYNLNVNYVIEKNLENIDAERQFVRDVSAKLKMCMTMVNDYEARKVVEKAYDAVRTSPLNSNDTVINYEVEIIRLAGVLENKVDEGAVEEVVNIANEIIRNTKKRNAML